MKHTESSLICSWSAPSVGWSTEAAAEQDRSVAEGREQGCSFHLELPEVERAAETCLVISQLADLISKEEAATSSS